jgi:hypothetical protein
MRQFLSPSPFEHFKGVIIHELSLVNSSFPKGSLLALLTENLQITYSYLSLRPCALFATEISQSYFWIYKIQGFNWPVHTLHGSMLHLHFSWYENNGISPEIFEIKHRPSSTHTLRTFTALLVGILRERNNLNSFFSSLILHTFNMKSYTQYNIEINASQRNKSTVNIPFNKCK